MSFEELKVELKNHPYRWCVTGAAGFIGSHLVENLLELGQIVVGLDNFSTGRAENLKDVERQVGQAYSRFTLLHGDIRDLEVCKQAVDGVDFVLHQAALGSVPRSIDDPQASHASNVDGFLNILLAARDASVKRFVYASSSSVYGDLADSPKTELRQGRLLSPYAVTKQINELYADNISLVYGLPVTGLRYFNVFGPRQDPAGAYAAVIPRWVDALVRAEATFINGDGETTRDFCYVANVVQANLLAALRATAGATVYNVAVGESTSLNELHLEIRRALQSCGYDRISSTPNYLPFRDGDIRHSLADTSRIRSELGYNPQIRVGDGIATTVRWFTENR